MKLSSAKGKLAVITGGSSGLGYAIAKELASQGFDLLLVARNEAQLKEASSKLIADSDVKVHTTSVDVSKEEDVLSLKETVRSLAPCADIIVNSAGIVSGGFLEDTPLAEWDRLYNVNVRGLVSVLKSLLPDMIKQGDIDGKERHIVNIASAAAYTATGGMSAYGSTKAGVLALSESLAHEVAPSHIGVTTVCPEFVKTPIGSKIMLFGRMDNARSKRIIEKMFDRSTITTEELAVKVLKAITSGKLVVPAGKQATIAYHFKRVMPVRFFKMIDKALRF